MHRVSLIWMCTPVCARVTPGVRSQGGGGRSGHADPVTDGGFIGPLGASYCPVLCGTACFTELRSTSWSEKSGSADLSWRDKIPAGRCFIAFLLRARIICKGMIKRNGHCSAARTLSGFFMHIKPWLNPREVHRGWSFYNSSPAATLPTGFVQYTSSIGVIKMRGQENSSDDRIVARAATQISK